LHAVVDHLGVAAASLVVRAPRYVADDGEPAVCGDVEVRADDGEGAGLGARDASDSLHGLTRITVRSVGAVKPQDVAVVEIPE